MNLQTNFARLDALYPVPAEELSRQWVLCDGGLPQAPAGWRKFGACGYLLRAHPDAKICSLVSSDGELLGWVAEALAFHSEQGDRVLRDGDVVELPIGTQPTEDDVERALYGRDHRGRSDGSGLQGNWTAILPGMRRVYLGPTHSVVFSRSSRQVATSHNLIPGLRRDESLSAAVDPLARNSHYLFGLTPWTGLERLLPNHALNLDDMSPVRHWPRRILEPVAPEAAAAVMVQQARRIIETLATGYEVFQLPMSAGRDSRAILACLRPLAERAPHRIRAFTTSMPGISKQTDVQIARKVTRLANLPLKVTRSRRSDATPEEIMRTFVRIGEARAEPILLPAAVAARGVEAGGPSVVDLPGMAGETARRFYWEQDVPSSPLTLDQLLRRTRAEPHPRVREAAQAWLDGLPNEIRADACDTLDLAYVEQRMGTWEAIAKYLFPGKNRANMNLMGTTLAIETMLRLPQSYRATGRLQEDMVAFGWPELLALPINRPVGLLRLRQMSVGAVRRAKRLLSRMKPKATATQLQSGG